MAFQPAPQASAPGTRTNSAANREYEKALGFINIFVPTKGGSRRKVGTLPLNASKPVEKYVFDALVSGGEDALRAFASKMIVEFNPQLDENDPNNELDI